MVALTSVSIIVKKTAYVVCEYSIHTKNYTYKQTYNMHVSLSHKGR